MACVLCACIGAQVVAEQLASDATARAPGCFAAAQATKPIVHEVILVHVWRCFFLHILHP